jgi:lipoprotein-releasing system permease protein
LNWNESQVGGLEIFFDSNSNLEKKTEEIYDSIEDFLSVRSVNEQFSEIYSWINLFNYNISLIIIIMIFVGGINMITSLLALIIEQTNMIATVRILGSSIKSVQKIFLIQGAYLITIGLFFGNVIGLSFLIIQEFTGIISLNPETYYVKKVPVYINFSSVLLINLITFFSCMLFLLIPTYVITKMSPIKSISLNK